MAARTSQGSREMGARSLCRDFKARVDVSDELIASSIIGCRRLPRDSGDVASMAMEVIVGHVPCLCQVS